MRHVVLSVPEADAELGADRLWIAGATAVEERSDGERTLLIAVLAQDEERSLERVGELPDGWELSFAEVGDERSDAWRNVAEPIRVNDELLVRPAWTEPIGHAGVTEISIEPGASFGLGDHPTTRLAAAATWRLAEVGHRVLDVGCGSGVLAVIAARRGAAEIEAIDIAEAAAEATLANAARNGVMDRIAASTRPLADVVGEFDLVLANILAPVLISLAADLRRVTKQDGHLVLAGVLADRWQHVVDALAPMELIETARIGEWDGLVLRAP